MSEGGLALIPGFFIDCVVALGTQSEAGKPPEWSASGFLYGDFIETQGDQSAYAVYLVTNRHVFAGTKSMVVRFNPKGNDPAKHFDLPLEDASGTPTWLAHPDSEIDVAVIRINAQTLVEHGIQFNFFQSHKHVLDRAAALASGLTEGDGAFILGFPMGLVGGDRNYVIVRQGSIARIRDWLAGAGKHFLLDISVFPGNSGGPAVSRPDMATIKGTNPQRAANLIGLVKGYLTYRDTAISAQTGRPRIIFEENSGLAEIVPVDYIQETIRIQTQVIGPASPTEEAKLPPDEPREDKPPVPIQPKQPPKKPRKPRNPRKASK